MSLDRNMSRIKEVVGTWDNLTRLLRTGDKGALVPVVIPKDRRGFGWALWFGMGIYAFGALGFFADGASGWIGGFILMLLLFAFGGFSWWRSSLVEIEQG
ncbi:MAG: SPFH domain-containing protein, partial [Chloroflexota bacterium]